jgi:biotin transport system substrate-specific component
LFEFQTGDNLSTKTTQVRVPTVGSIVVTGTGRRVLVGSIGALVFALLTFVGANIEIPLRPVPITLQTLFVVLTGACVGRGFGLMGQSLYVGAGVVGLPVFAGSTAGLAIVTGPTGGYLIGFLLAPLLVGALIRRSERAWWQFAVFYLGSHVVLGLGVLHLALFYTGSFGEALALGYLPFIVGDLLKNAAAVSIYRSYRALARRV